MASRGDITELLLAWRGGDSSAADRLFPLVYDRLRRLARNELRRHSYDQTLSATGLVHEMYLKLIDQTRVTVNDRSHFFALAAKVMRHILVDRARRRHAAKRGGGKMVALDEVDGHEEPLVLEILAIDTALSKLEGLDARLARMVELRFFGGLSVEEAAEVLDVSPRTVKRDWQKARAFLHHELSPVDS